MAHQTHLPILAFHSAFSVHNSCFQFACYSHAFASIYAHVNTFPTAWRALMLRINEVQTPSVAVHTKVILSEVSVLVLSPQVNIKIVHDSFNSTFIQSDHHSILYNVLKWKRRPSVTQLTIITGLPHFDLISEINFLTRSTTPWFHYFLYFKH
jgi:hypothetical protein